MKLIKQAVFNAHSGNGVAKAFVGKLDRDDAGLRICIKIKPLGGGTVVASVLLESK